MINPKPIFFMLCDLSEWCFLNIVQPPLLSSLPCRLKRKPCFAQKALAMDPFSSTFMNCWLWFYNWFRRGFYPKSLQPEKKNPLVSPVEPASRTSPGAPAWRLRLIDGFKFIFSARSMGNMFIVQIWITYIDIVACKMCVITRVRSWMGSIFQYLDPWLPNIFPGIAKKKGKAYATKKYHYLLMTRLTCDQLEVYFLCNNHVPVFYP